MIGRIQGSLSFDPTINCKQKVCNDLKVPDDNGHVPKPNGVVASSNLGREILSLR